jgi:hexosaminidase
MNKHFSLLFVCVCMVIMANSQTASDIAIIPQPVSLQKKDARFIVNAQTRITADKNADVQRVVRFFAEQARKATGYGLAVQAAPASKTNLISFSLNRKENAALGKEGYTIDVTAAGIQVQANQPAGLFYGVQTLLQLLPYEIESKAVVKKNSWVVPGVHITDYPRFGWRGLLARTDVRRFPPLFYKGRSKTIHR